MPAGTGTAQPGARAQAVQPDTPVIARVKRIFRDDLFPAQAVNSNFIASVSFADIINILQGLIDLKELLNEYQPNDSSKTEDLKAKLQAVKKDMHAYISSLNLRFTLTVVIARLTEKEKHDLYWEILQEGISVLQPNNFKEKFKEATGYELGDTTGSNHNWTKFNVFRARLEDEYSYLKQVFSTIQKSVDDQLAPPPSAAGARSLFEQ